jgi:hypothetical protein
MPSPSLVDRHQPELERFVSERVDRSVQRADDLAPVLDVLVACFPHRKYPQRVACLMGISP